MGPDALMTHLRTLARNVKGKLKRLSQTQPGPLILMYHRISEAKPDPWRLAVSPNLFDEQLALLKKRRNVLPLVEFGLLHRGGRLPAKAVAITFDDGYACNAHTAAPLLAKHGAPATIFLATGWISSPKEFWWDALERIISVTAVERLELSLQSEKIVVELGKPGQCGAARIWDATAEPRNSRQAAYLHLWTRLRLVRDEECQQAMASLHQQAGVSEIARESHRIMTAAEVQQAAASGLIEIGAHSVTHRVLSGRSREEQSSEICLSRDACRDLVSHSPRAFAYPFGDYDDDTLAATADAGFQIACTTTACCISRRTERLEMPRLQVNGWNSMELIAAMRNLDRA
jgi:peptidoglycan/xylan/chitin deacetylase (PgdA/CDA1 family)